MQTVVLLTIWVLSSCVEGAQDEKCKPIDDKKPDCGCQEPTGLKVDFHGLGKLTTIGKNYTYAIQLCEVFTSTGCINVHGCQTDSNNQGRAIAVLVSDDPWSGSIPTKNGESKLKLLYTTDPTNGRTTHISLECHDSNHKLEYVDEKPEKNYIFTLKTKRACGHKPAKGLSAGSILCIIFFVGIIVYLIAGILYNKFVLGARGIELIPNLDFWKELPLLIKDGFIFVKNGCRTESTYDQI